jgi:PEP-CTERM motif
MMRHHLQSQLRRVLGSGYVGPHSALSFAMPTSWALVLSAIVLCVGIRQAEASVLTNGNVLPADNPFTPDVDEGIPIDGNFIDTTVAADQQVTFEGRVDTKGNTDPTDDTNVNFDVIVGQTSAGVLLISGESALRDENLIIGDSGIIPGAGGTRQGTGVVRITGFGSLYNNDPAIIPPGLPNNFSSVNPRASEPGAGTGFDLWVGRSGNGTLEISAGARAEIQDAAIVGDLSGSSGTLIVDGVDSFLGSGGFSSGAAANGELHEMVIGHLGAGAMNVTNGGQVFAVGPNPSAANQMVIAAVVGSDPTSIGQPVPFAGGQGSVTVDGIGSKWVVGGSVQLGGFNSTKITNSPPTQDIAGGTVQYQGNAGRGALNVSNGGSVNLVPPTILTGTTNLDLDVLVGLYGSIRLSGGTIQIANGTISTAGGNGVPSLTTYRLLNDGNVGGSGAISVGQFRNRALGQVHVAAAEKLVVNSTGQFFNPLNDEELLSNYGLIDVLGTEQNRAEINFNYTPNNVTGINALTRPFINFRPVAGTVTNGGRQQGDILGQSSTFRFQSGIENHGNIKFTGGTNIVSGNVSNCAAGDPVCVGSATGRGLILITGANTSVTFEDSVFNSGTFQIDSQNSPVVIDGNLTFGNNSLLMTTLGSHISVAGDLIFSGTTGVPSFFAANLLNLNTLAVGDEFSFLTFSGNAIGISPGAFLGAQPLGNGFELQAKFFQNALQFVVCSNLGVCTAGGMLPPVNDADLNGDGIVNDADLAIWRARFGQMGLGDVNGDGIVDAADYTIIRDHFGLSMGAGAGSGAAAGGAVPEPASLMLLSMGASLALAFRCRRTA